MECGDCGAVWCCDHHQPVFRCDDGGRTIWGRGRPSRCGAINFVTPARQEGLPISVACWYNASGFVALSVIVLIVPSQFHAVSQPVLMDLIFLGVIGAGMQIVLTSAYRYSDAVVVASMRYLQMPLSGVVGYVVFAETMSVNEILGRW